MGAPHTSWRGAFLATLTIDATMASVLVAASTRARSRHRLRDTAMGGWMLAATAYGTMTRQPVSPASVRRSRALLYLGALVNATGSTSALRAADRQFESTLAVGLLAGGSVLSAAYLATLPRGE